MREFRQNLRHNVDPASQSPIARGTHIERTRGLFSKPTPKEPLTEELEPTNGKKTHDTLQAIFTQAESLQSLIYKDARFDPESAKDQYYNLKTKLSSIDNSVKDHSPVIRVDHYDLDKFRSSARIAVSQMVAYIRAKYVAEPKEPEPSAVAGSVVNFLMMLPTYGLTVRWAVAAAMLSSLEVITNMNLTKLKLPYDPSESFDKRLNKLNNALTSNGIALPALLLSALYKVRNKVVHEGKEPTTEEMNAIFELLSSLHEKTNRFTPND